MRAVIQRVCRASVVVDGEIAGAIGPGLMVLLGVHQEDAESDARWLAEKIAQLRIFDDEQGKMNRSLLETGGSMLVVSQFTLYGDACKGRRPSFVDAARPEQAIPLYELFVRAVCELGVEVQTGRFGAMMQLELVNEGPVTLILETREPAS